MSRVQSNSFYSTCNKAANPPDNADQMSTPCARARTHQTRPDVAHVLAVKATFMLLLPCFSLNLHLIMCLPPFEIASPLKVSWTPPFPAHTVSANTPTRLSHPSVKPGLTSKYKSNKLKRRPLHLITREEMVKRGR